MRTWVVAVVLLTACGGAEQSARGPATTTTTAAEVHPQRVEAPVVSREPMPATFSADQLGTTNLPTRIQQPSTGLNDAQIAGITLAADRMQIRQARLALGRTSDPRVRDLAQRIYAHHHDAEIRWAMMCSSLGLTALPTAASQELDVENESTVARLGGTSPRVDFDKAYVEVLVRAQRRLLDTIDYQLIPSAHAVQVQRWLLGFRAQVADDLARAHDLQQTLAN